DSAFADLSDLMSSEIARRLSIPVWLSASFNPGVTVATKALYGIDLKSISPEKAIARLPYPDLLIHSQTDERIPYEHSVRLKAASPNPDTILWTVDRAEHSKTFVTYPDEYVDRVMKYLDSRWIKVSSAKPFIEVRTCWNESLKPAEIGPPCVAS
ncbi:MAG: alpha/beta hydrolase, partial [Chloroflexota bacterium]